MTDRFATWWSLLRDRLFPSLADDELREEMRLHLAIETDRLRQAGYGEADAHRIALERFGDPARFAQAIRDERHSLRGIGTMQDVRFAARVLKRNLGFTLVCLVTLAVGIGAATAAFTIFDTVLLRPLAFAEPSRLVLLRETTEDRRIIPPSYPNFADWRLQSRTFADMALQQYPFSATVIAGTEPVRASLVAVSRGYFNVLGVQPVVGRTLTDDEHRPGGPLSAVVSHDFWMEKLGGQATLGTLRVGDATATVVGVLPRDFRLVGAGDVYYAVEPQASTIRSAHNSIVVGRLAVGATIDGARAELATIASRLRETYGSETEAVAVDVTPLRDYLVGDYTMLLTTVFAAAAVVLLIACTNLVSAQLARGMSRRREISIRGALGASRTRIARQLFVESAMLSVAGAVGGVVVAIGLTKLVTLLGAGLVPRLAEATVDLRILAFASVITVFTSMLVGVYPALRLATHARDDTMRTRSHSGGTVGARAWGALVGFEIALAVVLVIGSTLLVRTMSNIMGADVGFDPRGVVAAALSPTERLTPAEIARVHRDVTSIPGVVDAAFATRFPLQWGNESGPVLRPTDPPDKWPAMAGFRAVSAGYFEVMQQRVLQGRSFTPADDSGALEVAIVTQGLAARLWPGENAVGKIVRTNYLYGRDLAVVGVVAEASSWRMPRGEQNEIFVPILQHPAATSAQLILMARTTNPEALLPALRERLRAALPLTPATLGTMEERIARSAADRRFATLALGLFALVALVLAGVGVYGVISYGVASRTHEIGVRMALGASPVGVRLLILRGAALTAAVGIVAGVLASVFASRLLESLLYNVAGVDVSAYAVGALFLLTTALLAAFVPARRASRIDPLVAIRSE